jgi:drug/metabolite transporter (DMT)-like permease
MQWKSVERLAFLALIGGASGIGCAPIFVRLSEVGPSATAFYRVLFALPLLWAAAGWPATASNRGSGHDVASHSRPELKGMPTGGGVGTATRSAGWVCVWAGTFFALDLAFWHWSLKLTSVANSTLLTNCAPFFVMLGGRILFRERITPFLVLGMIVASIGAALLVGANLRLSHRYLVGDGLALVTAFFYGSYLLSVKYLRVRLSTAQVLAWSGLVSCGLLLLFSLASHESIRVISLRGWIVLVGLSLVSHILGQGLIAFALAHLPAGFSAVSLLVQPVVAAVLAWVVLAEPLSMGQVTGGIVVLAGIALASFGR